MNEATARLYRSAAGAAQIQADYARQLAAWPVPHMTRQVPTRFGATHVVLSGDPAHPPLIALHGHGLHAGMWAAYVAYWPDYYIITPDIIGQPGYSAAAMPQRGSAAYAAWLADVCDALGLQRAAVLGMSFGGLVALQFATAYPERTERLLLLAPMGISAPRLRTLLPAVIPAVFGERGARRALRNIAKGALPAAEEALMVPLLAHFRGKMPLDHLSDEKLRRLTMPVLLLIGDQDVFFAPAPMIARLCRLVPHCIAHLIPGETHYFNKQRAQHQQTLHDFLRDNP